MSGGAIAGLVSGALIILIASIFGGMFLLKQRRKRLMHVGRNQRSYSGNGYPEPDLSRPPVAAFKRESRPVSGYRNSGYDNLPTLLPRSGTESGVFDRDDLVPPPGLVGGRIRTSSYYSTGSGQGHGDRYRNSSYSAVHVPNAIQERASRTSTDLDPQQLEWERMQDLQQQARSMELSGEVIETLHSAESTPPMPLSPTSPTSPHNLGSRSPLIHAQNATPVQLMQGAGSPATSQGQVDTDKVPFAAFQGGAQPLKDASSPYVPPPQHQMQHAARSGYYESQPIPVAHGAYSQAHGHDVPLVAPRPQTQFYPSNEQQQSLPYHSPYPLHPRPSVSSKSSTPAISTPGLGSKTPPPYESLGGHYQGLVDQTKALPAPPGDKQELDTTIPMPYYSPASPIPRDPSSNTMSIPTTPSSPHLTTTDSILSKNSPPLAPGITAQYQVNTTGGVLPSTVASSPTDSHMGDKEEYRLSQHNVPDAVAGTDSGNPGSPASETRVTMPPPLPVGTRPKV